MRVSPNGKPQNSQLYSSLREGDVARRGQPLALSTAVGDGLGRLPKYGAHRIVWAGGISRHHRPALFPVAWPPFLLLVFTRTQISRCSDSILLTRASHTSRHS